MGDVSCRCQQRATIEWECRSTQVNVNQTSYRPGGGETVCFPADDRSTRGGSTGPQSAHLWWPARWRLNATALPRRHDKSAFSFKRRCKRDTARVCCWAPCCCGYRSKGGRACCRRAVQQSIDVACPQQQIRRGSGTRWDRQTDRQTDTVSLHRPAAQYASSANKEVWSSRLANVSGCTARVRRLPYKPKEYKQLATIVVATARIAAAARIVQSYSPGDANVHHHPIGVHGSMDP